LVLPRPCAAAARTSPGFHMTGFQPLRGQPLDQG
jgi:hypothetical protein